MKLVSTLVGLAALVLGASAQAQDVSSVKSESNPPLRRVSVEVRPLESLISATPGIASGGLSIETYLGHNFGLRIGGSYADVNLPDRIVNTANEERDTPVVEKGYGHTAGAGLRYYDNPIGDSLYAGGDIDYSMLKTTWKFNDDRFAVERYAVEPSIVAGYRWVWQNGVLARIGAGAGLPRADSQTVTAETDGPDAAEGLDKINDALDTPVLAKLDFGFGMMF